MRIYRFLPKTEELYYELENATDERSAWRVKTWTATSIILEGIQEVTPEKIYCTIPLRR